MQTPNWKTDRIGSITAEEFYTLIDRNREHIAKTFPVTLSGCYDLKKTVKFIQLAVDNETYEENYYFYLRSLDTNALIGYVMIKNIDYSLAKCELGYFIDIDFEGKGITSQAVKNVLDFCFGEIKMNKVTICTSLVNTASQRVATKHGFVQEGMLRQEFKNGKGQLEDILYFGLLKQDYK